MSAFLHDEFVMSVIGITALRDLHHHLVFRWRILFQLRRFALIAL
jgi:hypothetical protein